MIPRDTNATSHAAQVAALRRLGADGRVRIAADMSEAMRQIAIDGVRRRNPDITEAEAKRIVARHTMSAVSDLQELLCRRRRYRK